MLAYLDVETYSPGENITFSDKVILICYEEVSDDYKIVVFREWEEGEKAILQKFYNMLKRRIKSETVTLIGWNIIRFDIPFLTYRLFFHEIDDLDNILETFRGAYWRDLRQCLLPFNKYSFKGLSEEEVAKKFKIEPPKHSNKYIKIFYENGEYEKIEEHTSSEIRFFSELSLKMRDLREIIKAFGGVV